MCELEDGIIVKTVVKIPKCDADVVDRIVLMVG